MINKRGFLKLLLLPPLLPDDATKEEIDEAVAKLIEQQDMLEKMANVTEPPQHINCKCVLQPIIINKEIIRDIENGN